MARLRPPFTAKSWLLLLAVAAFIIYGLSGGCYAQRLPAAPSPAQVRLLQASVLPYSVVVTPWDSSTAARLDKNSEAYALATFRWLDGSGAFAHVRLGTPGDTDGDFAATPTGVYCNTAVIPVWTALSLGIVPLVFTDTDCKGVVLRSLAGGIPGGDSLVVQQQHSGRVVMGWAAVVVGALPGWTHGEAKDHRRYHQQARLAILARSVAMAALK